VLVMVCAFCSACADLCDSGPESNKYAKIDLTTVEVEGKFSC